MVKIFEAGRPACKVRVGDVDAWGELLRFIIILYVIIIIIKIK